MWLQDLLTLSSWHHTPNAGILNLLNEMATHSSVLAWRIPRMGEPSGLPSLGSHRVRHDWSKLAAAAAAAAAIRLSVQSLSHFWLFETSWTAARQASLSINNSWSLLKLISIESVMPSDHLILYHPLLLLPSTSQNQDHFQRVSSTHQVVKVLEFQLQHQSFQRIFRTDFL